MAVTEMKKFTVICQASKAEALVRRLMWLSCVDIRQTESDGLDGVTLERPTELDAQITEYNRTLQKIKEAMKLLASYDTKAYREHITLKVKKKPFSPPSEIDFDEFVDSGRYEVALSKLDKILRLSKMLSDKKAEQIAIGDEYHGLLAWKGYGVPLNVRGTAYTDLTLGTLGKKANIAQINRELEKSALAEVIRVGADKHAQYVSVISHKSDTENALRILLSKGFSPSNLPSIDGTIDDAILALEERANENIENIEKIKAQIASFVGFEAQLEITHDIIMTRIVELEARKKLAIAGSVCIINGWTPVASCERVEGLLKKFDSAYELEDPSPEDDVPVLIKNNAFASAFEPVISLYSLPKYKTFDPTFIMSIFYTIIFGLMFADVGYGIILALGCFLAIKLLYPRGTMKKFFQMFAICGISCAVWGAILGGYLGDFPSTVLGIDANVAIWFDPIQDPMTFLVLSVAVGAIHMITGMIVKMVILIKQRQIFSAIFDVGSWIVVFVGIALALLNTKVGLITALTGVLMLILTQGRAQKNILMKIVKGVGSLYSITSYASDLLSYTRILALGLASAVIAKVVNIIASLGGENIVGYLLLIIVLLIGHTLNMVINLLGTFVHASRLQYIEFFGKFYEEGGTPFELVAPKSKYVLFKSKKDI